MPNVRDDEVDGTVYGTFKVFNEGPARDPFRISRDLMVGDYLTIDLSVSPTQRTYEVLRVRRHGEAHYPGVELMDLASGRKGIMTQASLNRIRPLRIYHPHPQHRPAPLIQGAIYQDIVTGACLKVDGGFGGIHQLVSFMPGQPYANHVPPFTAIAARPKLVLRWAPHEDA